MNNFRPAESFQDNTVQTLVLVDYSNLLYRAWFVSSKRRWIAYCKFFDMLRLCIKRSKQPGVPLNVIFADESKTILDRKKIDKNYKGTRKRDEDPNFKEFREGLAELIDYLGWGLLHVDGAEADDVIASIVAKYCHRCLCKTPCKDCECHLKYKTDIVIFSGDRDLQTCLAWDRTMIYRAPGLFIDRKSFAEEHGFPIEKYNIYKAIIGDTSDNIKGVEGMGPAKATKAIQADTVAVDIWEMHGPKGVKAFKKALSLVNMNTKLKLFDMDRIISLYSGPPQFDEKEFVKKYDKKILLEVQRLKEEF